MVTLKVGKHIGKMMGKCLGKNRVITSESRKNTHKMMMRNLKVEHGWKKNAKKERIWDRVLLRGTAFGA